MDLDCWEDTSIDCATNHPGYGYHWWTLTIDGYEAVVGSGFGGQRILSIPELDITAVVVHDTRREQPCPPPETHG